MHNEVFLNSIPPAESTVLAEAYRCEDVIKDFTLLKGVYFNRLPFKIYTSRQVLKLLQHFHE